MPFLFCTPRHPVYKRGHRSEAVHVNCDSPSQSIVLGQFGKEEVGRRIHSTRPGAVGEILFCHKRMGALKAPRHTSTTSSYESQKVNSSVDCGCWGPNWLTV